MTQLKNKRILVIVAGGIAAYKSLELVRRLRDADAAVRVVMTQAAQQFVGQLSFQALSGQIVRSDLLDPGAEAAMGHIELARWADAVVIAPATADILARVCAGLAKRRDAAQYRNVARARSCKRWTRRRRSSVRRNRSRTTGRNRIDPHCDKPIIYSPHVIRGSNHDHGRSNSRSDRPGAIYRQ
jgi:hypothetical protein